MIHTLGALVKYLLELKQDCRIKTIDYSGNRLPIYENSLGERRGHSSGIVVTSLFMG